MLKTITLTIPHAPISQPRQRHRIVRKKDGTDFVQNYTPKDAPVQVFKAAVQHYARQEFWGEPLDGPLRVDIVFVLPRPKNKVLKTKPMPRYLHTIKPDRDNLDKAVMDALTGLLWRDDCQVCDGRIQKWVASGDEQPHVEITVTEIEDNNG